MFREWTFSFELTQAVVRVLMSQYGDRLGLTRNAQFLRRQSEIVGSILGLKTCRDLNVRVQPFRFGGLEHLWLKRVGQRSSCSSSHHRRFVLLYFHGGGYGILSPRMYISVGAELQSRISSLLKDVDSDVQVDVDVLLANYRKAPEHRYPAGPEDAFSIYTYLLEEEKLSPKQIIVAGDSAGAGLAMTTLLRARDHGGGSKALPLAGMLAGVRRLLRRVSCS
ncbi:hypothetical protein P43SY_011404 [Pythium insidiosum]|uniref:Alpha/beta hydrolase fold-3 domain-containing protein n=1 Tax=Pythium insidiosum TaxID=114742 RepID=A0AAD5Q458_PYTIN|nr:hypothetical protein P43SY_011404 [Pythium insidiosum]